MITYLSAFIFYTMAMVGILLVAFIIYKKTMVPTKVDSKSIIKVLDSTPIGAKKNLLVVKVKNEKFLIASGIEHTTFLAKLEDNKLEEKEETLPEMPVLVQEKYVETPVVDEQKEKLNDIERQFKRLYSQTETDYKKEYAQKRRDMVRELLKELNETTAGSKFEGKF